MIRENDKPVSGFVNWKHPLQLEMSLVLQSVLRETLTFAASVTGCSSMNRVAVSLKCKSDPLSAVCNFKGQEKVIFSSQ